jgi:hypothetical protein
MLKSMLPIVKMADKLLELKSNSKTATRKEVCEFLHLTINGLLTYSLNLLSWDTHAVYEVNIKRRELIKLDLNEQFKQLWSSQMICQSVK